MKKQKLTTLKLKKEVISSILGGTRYPETSTCLTRLYATCGNGYTCKGDACNTYQCPLPS